MVTGLSSKGAAMSDNIWGSLRLGLSLLGRSDLYKWVESRDLASLNKVPENLF
jgi:hypothetical protein